MAPRRPVIKTKAPWVNLERRQKPGLKMNLRRAYGYEAAIHDAWLGPLTPRALPMESPPPTPAPKDVIYTRSGKASVWRVTAMYRDKVGQRDEDSDADLARRTQVISITLLRAFASILQLWLGF